MVELGVRVRFYKRVGADGDSPQGFLGELERTDGYRAAGVPAVGDRVMHASLRVGPREDAAWLPGPAQLVVQSVEHHLVPEREGEVPSWWDSYTEPSATVVFHLPLGPEPGDEQLRKLVRRYVADGWMCTGPEGSVLREYGLEAWSELGQSPMP